MVLVFYTNPEAPAQCAVEISRALALSPQGDDRAVSFRVTGLHLNAFRMASIELLQACKAIGVRRVYLSHLAIAPSSQSARRLCSRRTIIFEASSLKSSAAACFRDDGWELEQKPSAFPPRAQQNASRRRDVRNQSLRRQAMVFHRTEPAGAE